MCDVLILSASDACSTFYARLFDRIGLGKYSKNLPNDFLKYKKVIWISVVKNSQISDFKSFLDQWDELRYKKLVFVLVGNAPEDSTVYKHLWDTATTKSIFDKVHFFPFCDKRTIVDNSFFQFIMDLFYSFSFNFKRDQFPALMKIIQCVELLG